MTDHEHEWKQTGPAEVACRVCGIEPRHLHRFGEPIDDLHRDCLEAKFEIRRQFTSARLRLGLGAR
jgi:hypothetical protein